MRARISRPATFTPDTLAYGEIDIAALDEPTFRLVGISVEAGVEHWFSPKLEGALGLGLRTFVFEDAADRESATLLYLPAELTWDNRDDIAEPHHRHLHDRLGHALRDVRRRRRAARTADGRAATSALGEDGPHGSGRSRAAGSCSAATSISIPPDYLFYSGGSGTVRGQEYQSLGAIQNGVPSGRAQFRDAVGRGSAGPRRHEISASSCLPMRDMSGRCRVSERRLACRRGPRRALRHAVRPDPRGPRHPGARQWRG
jgi:translocation and assembly module TamA